MKRRFDNPELTEKYKKNLKNKDFRAIEDLADSLSRREKSDQEGAIEHMNDILRFTTFLDRSGGFDELEKRVSIAARKCAELDALISSLSKDKKELESMLSYLNKPSRNPIGLQPMG